MNPIGSVSSVQPISFVDGPQPVADKEEERIDETQESQVRDEEKSAATSVETRANTSRNYTCGTLTAELASLALGVGLIAVATIFLTRSNQLKDPFYSVLGLVTIAPGYILFSDSWNNLIYRLIRRTDEI